ncbi:MAG: hypothetical protein ACRDQV_07210 [Pseudonocardiaceae bacterium]
MTEPARSDADLVNSATGAGLIYFCDIMIKRNEMTKATGSALRTGCKKVLDTEDDPDTTELRTLDMEGLLRRFVNKNRADLNDRSLQTYQQRFRQTVDMYLKFIDRDPNWNTVKVRAGGLRSPVNIGNGTRSSKSGNVVEMKPTGATSEAASNSDATPALGMIEWSIPVRPGVVGKLVLPDSLTHREAQKVVKVVTALAHAFEEQLACRQEPLTPDGVGKAWGPEMLATPRDPRLSSILSHFTSRIYSRSRSSSALRRRGRYPRTGAGDDDVARRGGVRSGAGVG